ncbi:MAG: hypothetical protein ACREMA_15620, partial [Longimicrobiales bacterium]
DQDSVAYLPLIGVKVLGSEGVVGEDPTPINDVTGADGLFSTGCDTEFIYSITFELRADNTLLQVGDVATVFGAPSGCSDEQVIALSDRSGK